VHVEDAVVVVTGGGRGIGRAMCQRFAAEGARGIVVADVDEDAARDTARLIGGLAVHVDASVESDVIELLDATEREFGTPDLVCANAGAGADGGLDAPTEVWERAWRLNVWSHVLIARHSVARMVPRGSGYLLHTASAAGLLSMPGAAPYAVSKHGAVAVAEYVAITYGSRGIGVSCLCPQAVRTRLLEEQTEPEIARRMRSVSTVLEPDDVADAVIAGLAAEQFLILPHQEVATHYRRRATDPDRWIAGMRRALT
jgi:NAD(P)-dependent dehydrogenase (short-subunit alcohol dehydrogenase family)